MWTLELDGTRCALHYLKRWCLIDIASIVPFDLLLLARASSHHRRDAALLRLPRALKLLRLPRFFRCVPLRLAACRMCMLAAALACMAPAGWHALHAVSCTAAVGTAALRRGLP